MENIEPKVGEVWLVDLSNAIGHQQRGVRPFVVCSNNKRNKFSPTVKGVPVSKQTQKRSPVHVFLSRKNCPFLEYDSVALCEEVATLNKTQFLCRLGKISDKLLADIAFARCQDEPFLLMAFVGGVQNTEKFQAFASFA